MTNNNFKAIKSLREFHHNSWELSSRSKPLTIKRGIYTYLTMTSCGGEYNNFVKIKFKIKTIHLKLKMVSIKKMSIILIKNKSCFSVCIYRITMRGHLFFIGT